jgi:2-methylaconitate cis-trans-isomerase PrpF
MGTPDVLQIDGLGGSRPITYKVAIIAASTRPDADVDHTFAQVDINRPGVGYAGNCGNISSGVGPFAIDEGLVEAVERVTWVRIFNTNALLIADVTAARRPGELLISHPSGVTPTKVEARIEDGAALFDVLGFSRTARRLMAGTAYHPVIEDDVEDGGHTG